MTRTLVLDLEAIICWLLTINENYNNNGRILPRSLGVAQIPTRLKHINREISDNVCYFTWGPKLITWWYQLTKYRLCTFKSHLSLSKLMFFNSWDESALMKNVLIPYVSATCCWVFYLYRAMWVVIWNNHKGTLKKNYQCKQKVSRPFLYSHADKEEFFLLHSWQTGQVG